MSDLTVTPVICWEEWAAIFHSLFKRRSNLRDVVVNKPTYLKGLDYLQCVLQRDKYKNNLSLGYTVDFLKHYARLNEQKRLGRYSEGNEVIRVIGLDIVRFSSQMADMCQKKNVKSISAALSEMGMQEFDFIAEVRHALTHKQLPSQLLIEKALIYLIEFIYEKYWLEQYSSLAKSDQIDFVALEKYLGLVLGDENEASKVIGANRLIEASCSKKMSNIIADNIQTFRRRLGGISIGFAKNYDGEQDLAQIDNLKKKKQHLAYFISEMIRIILKIVFYARHSLSRDDRELILSRITSMFSDMAQDSDFKKTFAKITQVSFISYKILRVRDLCLDYPELKPLVSSIDLLLNKEKDSVVAVAAVANEVVQDNSAQEQTIGSLEIPSLQSLQVEQKIDLNKFGCFSLKVNHAPSLIGKKVLEFNR